ncbi:hypothetical protein F5Y08DRAFT_317418 [Xylaria arbuscula]|uniref:Uncharacterized protein n=1 Tax=Xylaria arbuscula TaxID=114810 RepID=A0A9W8NIC5_9PEZI|nr:hypothetical protein F5Y08DRAFT_317418 [Xylaria arbuscula]KAJ3577681.1 hypothetical protein NPX13_g2887 [Xylaria arbuscula]
MAVPEAFSRVGEAVVANLGKTGTIVFGGLSLLAPMLVATPVLWVLGFGNVVRGGSFAARAMARAGNVVARGLYATVQSAAAAGYGVARVAGIVRIIGAIAIFLVLLKIYQDYY